MCLDKIEIIGNGTPAPVVARIISNRVGEIMPTQAATEYREKARECDQLSAEASDLQIKLELRDMSRRWRALADRVEKQGQ